MVLFSEDARPILEELKLAEDNYIQAQFSDFTDEELMQYTYLFDKQKNNIRRIL